MSNIEIKKELSYCQIYYQKNKDKIKEKYNEKKLIKSQYNKQYYEKIKKEKRTTWEYYNYQRNYYRLKKQGLRPSDLKKQKEFIESKNENKTNIVTFD